MAISLKKEDSGLGPPFEDCFFCGSPTDTWYEALNIPVCWLCAQEHSVTELPGYTGTYHKDRKRHYLKERK